MINRVKEASQREDIQEPILRTYLFCKPNKTSDIFQIGFVNLTKRSIELMFDRSSYEEIEAMDGEYLGDLAISENLEAVSLLVNLVKKDAYFKLFGEEYK